QRPTPRVRAVPEEAVAGHLIAAIADIVAPVLGPRRFIVARILRLFLAEADRVDLRFGRTGQHHHPLGGVGATLTQRNVVLAAAALVGIALDRHVRVAISL